MSYGRQKIYSDAKRITAENVVDEVSRAHAVHVQNQAAIRKLWEYYRGKTNILTKTILAKSQFDAKSTHFRK